MSEKEERPQKKVCKTNSLSLTLEELIMGQGVAVRAGRVKTTIRKGYIVKVAPKLSNDINTIRVSVEFFDGGKLDLTIEETYDAIWFYQQMAEKGIIWTSKAEKDKLKKVRLKLQNIWQGRDHNAEGLLISSSTEEDEESKPPESEDAQTPQAASKPPPTEEPPKTPTLISSPGTGSKSEKSLFKPEKVSETEYQVQLSVAKEMTSIQTSQYEANCLDSKHHLAVEKALFLNKKQRKVLGRKAGLGKKGMQHDSNESRQLGYFTREFKWKPQDDQNPQSLDEKVSMIGQRVVRQFHGTLYFGTIDLFRPAEPYGATDTDLWQIHYDDGDTEDYGQKELLEFCYLYYVNRSLDPLGEPL